MGRLVAAYTHIAQASWLAVRKDAIGKLTRAAHVTPVVRSVKSPGKGEWEWDSEGNPPARELRPIGYR
jgi:hypothetical protein